MKKTLAIVLTVIVTLLVADVFLNACMDAIFTSPRELTLDEHGNVTKPPPVRLRF